MLQGKLKSIFSATSLTTSKKFLICTFCNAFLSPTFIGNSDKTNAVYKSLSQVSTQKFLICVWGCYGWQFVQKFYLTPSPRNCWQRWHHMWNKNFYHFFRAHLCFRKQFGIFIINFVVFLNINIPINLKIFKTKENKFKKFLKFLLF